MPRYVTVVPAYGRDYKSKAAVMEDWNAGKDFKVEGFIGSGYINKDDKPSDVTLEVRYDGLRKVCLIK